MAAALPRPQRWSQSHEQRLCPLSPPGQGRHPHDHLAPSLLAGASRCRCVGSQQDAAPDTRARQPQPAEIRHAGHAGDDLGGRANGWRSWTFGGAGVPSVPLSTPAQLRSVARHPQSWRRLCRRTCGSDSPPPPPTPARQPGNPVRSPDSRGTTRKCEARPRRTPSPGTIPQCGICHITAVSIQHMVGKSAAPTRRCPLS